MKVYDAPVMSKPAGCLLFLRPGSRVLEFGPGTGFATRYMQQALHCSVTCIEFAAEAADKARPFAEKMIVADIESDGWEQHLDGSFDFVVFGDVLEHLRDPRRAVERALRLLSKDGSVLTSVPNIGHNAILLNLRKGRFTYNEFGLLDNTHVHFFTRSSLSDLFNSLGLFAVSSNDNIARPCLTEFSAHYSSQPLFSLFILRNRDGHVYQFITEWKRGERAVQPVRHQRLSPLAMVRELSYDCLHLLFKKLPLSLQSRIKKRS